MTSLNPTSKQIGWFIACAAAALIFYGLQAYQSYADSGGRILARDYAVFRFAAILVWQGDFATLFDTAKFIAAHEVFEQAPVGFSPFPYPPSALWAVVPLRLLPAGAVGLIAWLGVTFALFAWPICRRRAQPWRTTAALLLAPGCIVNLAYGQNGFLTGALLAGGLLLLPTRPILAGLLFGLLTFKPQFGLLLPFVLLAGGYYRTFVAAAALTMMLALASLVLFGTAPWQAYLEVVMPNQRIFLESGSGLALLTTPSVFMGARLLGMPTTVNYALQAMAAVVVVAACVQVFRRRSASVELKAALVMVGAFLVTPYCSSSDMGLIAAAQILVLAHTTQLGERDRVLHGVVWALPVLMVPASLAHLPIGPLALGALFYGLFRMATAERTDQAAVSPASAP